MLLLFVLVPSIAFLPVECLRKGWRWGGVQRLLGAEFDIFPNHSNVPCSERCTGVANRVVLSLRECYRQIEAEVVRNSRNKKFLVTPLH